MDNLDVLIVIALKEEFDVFWKCLPAEPVARNLTNGNPYYTFTILGENPDQIDAAVVCIGKIGNEESRPVTEICVKELKPKLVINVGIAGAIDEDLRLGDVIIAKEVNNYLDRAKVKQKDPSKPLTFEDIEFAGVSQSSTSYWVTQIDNLKYTNIATWKHINDKRKDDYSSSIPESARNHLEHKHFVRQGFTLMTGPIASGPIVGASAEFKKKLREKNRIFIALEMEAYGVLDAIHNDRQNKTESIIIKAISDFGDERKKELDNVNGGGIRAWAMRNATTLLLHFVQGIDFAKTPISVKQGTAKEISSIEELMNVTHSIVVENYLADPYDKPSCVSKISYEAYSNFYKTVTVWLHPIAGNIFEHLYEKFKKQHDTLYARGNPGTGKTSFLSVLYWFLLDKRKQDSSAPIPFLVNFHRFNHHSASQDAVESLCIQLKVLTRVASLNKALELWVLVDGHDEFARHQNALWNELESTLKQCAQIRVIGMRPVDDNSYLIGQDQLALGFESVRTDSPKLKDFISHFIAISQFEGQEEALSEMIAGYNLIEVDLFTVSLIIKHKEFFRSNAGFSGLLGKHCIEFLIHRRVKHLLAPASNAAYNLEIYRGKLPLTSEDDFRIWELINSHSGIRNYLIAYYICEKLRAIGGGAPLKINDELNHVYPFKINKLCTGIINRGGDVAREVLNGIEKVLLSAETSHTAKANACYLAGRVHLDQFKNKAKSILDQLRERMDKQNFTFKNSDEEKRFLLLTRTMSISLSYLGEFSAQDEYIGNLLRKPNWDEFNRGFHLEYYGDSEYDPSVPLLSMDNLEPCPNTFAQLKKRLKQKKGSPITQIEFYTLVSLAQHRHVSGRLDAAKRSEIIFLIDEIISLHKSVISDQLHEYVIMVKSHLGLEKFSSVEPFHRLYQLKFTRRSGWIERKIADGESVTDHTQSAYLIGLYFLPERWIQDKAYSKEKILNMLLIHDLSEAITGDLLPEQRNEGVSRIESSIYKQIGMLGTYPDVAPLHMIDDLWTEFEHKRSINSLIAKEIDRLENLIQLIIYNRKPEYKIPDYATWRDGLINEIRTELGRKILSQLVEFYDNFNGEQRPVFKAT